ncbi:MAG: hypothetical protein ACR2NP_09495 [Pirellulaceae bacterium]
MFRINCCGLIAAFAIFLTSSSIRADVQATLINGDVVVTGDNGNNDVRISRIHGSLHLFRGLNGTTINGSSFAVLPIQDDLVIELEGGHDSLEILSLRARSVSHADVHIEMGDGDDQILINNASIARHLIIDTDRFLSGNDDIELENVRVGRFLIADLGDGLDRFFAIDCLVERTMDIEADEMVSIILHRNIADRIEIDSGVAGSDVIRVLNNDVETIEVRTSDESDDVIFMSNSIFTASGIVDLGGGDDVLDLRFNDFGFWGFVRGVLLVVGGPGRDTGIISDNGLFRPAVVLFEGTVR